MPINNAHWHLVLNHLPILGSFLGLFLVLFLYVRDSRHWETITLWWFVFMALLAIPVYFTGEPAEELVEGMTGVSHDAIEVHEEWAFWAFTVQVITGVFALGFLVYRRIQASTVHWVRHTFLGLVLGTVALMGYTATLGGHIHHPETRSGFTPPEEHEAEQESEQEAKQQEQQGKTGSARTYPGTVDLEPRFRKMLRKEMQSLESGMFRLLSHLVRRRNKKAARTATQIHERFILKQELSKKELKRLQKQLPADFVQLDQAFHKYSAELAEAAKQGQLEKAMDLYGQMSASCVTCHTRYARDRFSDQQREDAENQNEQK